MKAIRFAVQFAVAFLALIIGHMIAGMLVTIDAPVRPHMLRWLLLSEALVVAVLLPAVLRSRWHGWRLFLAVWSIPAIVALTNMVEGVIFLPHLNIDWRALVANAFLRYAVAVAIWVLLFARRKRPETAGGVEVHSAHVVRDVILGSVAYMLLYFVAGTLIFPYVRDFYATQNIPPLWKVLGLQLLVRGPIFVGLCVLLQRLYRLPLTASIVAVGVGWCILNGAAPLLIPNPYFPDSVRLAHLVETTWSNLAFGAFVTWLWGRTKREPVRAEAVA